MKKPKLNIPFHLFNYLFNDQINISIPLIDKEAIFINNAITEIKQGFKDHIADTILKDESYDSLIPYYKTGKFVAAQLDYEVKASSDGISFPTLSIPIQYFKYENGGDLWAVIPHLDIEAFSNKEEGLERNLRETIDLHLVSFYKYKRVKELLPLIWNELPTLKMHTLEIPFSKDEGNDRSSFENSTFLKKIGHVVNLKEKIAFGHDHLVEQVIKNLKTSVHKNILVVGPTQSGKTALIWEVIYQQHQKTNTTFIETTAAALIRELSNDNHWKVNIKILIEELNKEDQVLYIRNWLEMFEVGKSIENDISLGEYLYRFVETDKILLITECTEDQFSKIEIIKPGFKQFFQVVKQPSPKGKLLQEIVFAKTKSIADKKNIQVDTSAINQVIQLNKRFSPYAGMPGKAIRFLERIIHNQYLRLKKNNTLDNIITKGDIIEAFSVESGIPELITDPSIIFDSEKVASQFKKQLFGQDEAISTIVDMLAVVKTAMTNLNKPIASFLFAGSTGVGKTELAKILSNFIFSDRKRMIRFDMSEYSSFQSILKLLGTEHKAGLLASTIRKNPFSVLLFDEIDKAHPKFNEILLQILDEGRLTDGTEAEINFCSTIIIMTSNIGAHRISQSPVGFGNYLENDHIKESLLQEIRKHFAPEVFNRIDYAVIFYPITEDITELIVKREIEQLKLREGLKYRKVALQISDKAITFLAQKGFDSKMGARNIQRTIRKEVAIPLSEQLNQFDIEDHLNIIIDIKENKINISVEDDPLSVELLIEEVQIADLSTEATALRVKLSSTLNSYIYNQIKGKEEHLLSQPKRNHIEAKALVEVMALRQKVQELFDDTEKIETALSLAYLKFGTFRPDYEEDLAQFSQTLADTQLQMIALAYPNRNKHCLIYYGSRLKEVVPNYIELLENLGFKVDVNTIWHFPKQQLNFYKTQVDLKNDWAIKDDAYVIIPGWKDDILRSATLCGVQLVVSGPAISYFIEEENDVQEWNFPDAQIEKIIVFNSGGEEIYIPPKVHKLEFFKQKPPTLIINQFLNKAPLVKQRSKSNSSTLDSFFQERWKNKAAEKIELEMNA